MASTAGPVNTFSTQTSMAGPHREAGNLYCHPSGMDRSGARFCVTDGSSGSRDHSFESTPHPAYGSELSTGGGRLVRALTAMEPTRDRKSTRLNSSHLVISYAVFCLKKKKKTSRPCTCSSETTTS